MADAIVFTLAPAMAGSFAERNAQASVEAIGETAAEAVRKAAGKLRFLSFL